MLQQGLEAEFLEGCLEPLLLELRGRVKMQGSNPEQADPANQSTKKSRRRFVAIGLVSMEPEAVSQLVVSWFLESSQQQECLMHRSLLLELCAARTVVMRRSN